ncbi:DUF4124 domain-containing protein [Dyella sp.]|uniref:DUF4124 domain-containing protein n=1 Tax=Dyella sp. TaxID=1869338 RepID=UPI002ED67214
MRRTLLAAALLLVAPSLFAQAYKWTDSTGTVHYSENPPPSGTKYQRMTLAGSAEAPAGTAAASAPPPATSAPGPASANSQPMADTPANRSKFCTTLQSNLDLLKGSGPLVMQQDGQSKAVDDGQRKAQLATAQAQYKQYCSGK